MWYFETLRPITEKIDKWRYGSPWGGRDAEENQETKPPAGETITLQAIWAVEFYTPSLAARLFDGLRKLSWDKEELFGGNPIRWITQDRGTMLGGGWLNLGTILPEGNKHAFPDTRTAKLPDGVEFAQAAMFTLTSSLTCVIFQFIYSGTYASQYNAALNKNRKTFAQPDAMGSKIKSPHSQKKEDIEKIRTSARTNIWKWFKFNLPGIFSAENVLPIHFPTCELVTLKCTQPFPTRIEQTGSVQNFLGALGLKLAFYAWKIDAIPSVRFSTGIGREAFHAIAAAPQATLESAAASHFYTSDRNGALYFADSLFQRFLSRWGLIGLLSFLQQRVNFLRDSAEFRTDRRGATLRALSNLSEIEFQSLDVGTISAELQEFAKGGLFSQDLTDFVPVSTQMHTSNSLVESIKSIIVRHASWLNHADKQVHRTLRQQGSLIAARENIRLQKRMETLTKWIAVLTTLTVTTSILIAMNGDPDGRKILSHLVSMIYAFGSTVFAFFCSFISPS